MEETSYIVLVTFSVVVVFFVIYLHIKKWHRKIKISLNDIQGIQRFIELLFIYNQKTVFLNLTLSPALTEEFKNNLTLSLPQFYSLKTISGGFRVIFDQDNKDRLLDKKFIEPNRLKGYFRVMHQPGPNLGWFIILLQFPEK